MTKAEEKIKFKKILNQGFLTRENKLDLVALFKKHPYYKIKIGSGAKDIIVEKTKYGNNCFFILRKDGTQTDISYLQCINGESSKISSIKSACRSAIRSEILKVRRNVNFGVDRCIFTRELLDNQNTHIDHYNMKFNDVFKLWMKGKDIEDLFSDLNDTSKDMVNDIFFVNKNRIKDFTEFHNKNTHLRAISKTANLKLG
jgi:hypothetical protein